LGGIIWPAYDVAVGFTEHQYVAWVGYSKTRLPAGDPIARQEAVRVMRELCLDLRNRHRIVLVPAAFMLVGGLLAGARGRRAAGQLGDPR
jgi:hypothetical protein